MICNSVDVDMINDDHLTEVMNRNNLGFLSSWFQLRSLIVNVVHYHDHDHAIGAMRYWTVSCYVMMWYYLDAL